MQEDKVEKETPIAEKPTVKSVASMVFNFFKKHWKIFVSLVVFFILVATLFSFIPVISINKTKLVNQNTPVRIESGQTVKLKVGNVSVKIVNFTNETCPTDKTCFGNASGVEYMLTVDGQKYATGSLNTENASNYRVKTLSSDYKTYADIEISRVE